jgi:endo-1,4-beta-xylanase
MNRRDAILGALQTATCGLLATRHASLAAQGPTIPRIPLKAAARRLDCQIGVAADPSMLTDPVKAKIVTENFNLLTAGGMKWDALRPTAETYSFAEADRYVQFAEAHGMKVHGHNLCWNAPISYPAWFKTTLDKSNAREFLTSHIRTVLTHYKGRVDSWDVVNEPVVPWNVPGGLYPGIWLDLLGPEYIDIAFHAAAAADPKALLVLNIHHVEQGSAGDELNRGRALTLLRTLRSRGVPVQAVGIESHLDASQPEAGPALRRFIEEIRALNLQVLITELDVQETRPPGSSSGDWDRGVARYYGDYVSDVLATTTPHSLILWSLVDRWENGKKVQGLLQSNLSPRLSFGAVDEALQQGKQRP